MRRYKMCAAVSMLAAAAVLGGCRENNSVKLDPKNPVTVKIWHYYSGGLQQAFESLVDEFNSTDGEEQGIIIEPENHGTVNELADELLDSANGKAGAEELPNLFMGYADTVYAIDQLGLVAELDGYFTQEELDEYVPEFIEEGKIGDSEKLKIFPMAKSTEIFMMNKTDWDVFAGETKASLEDLSTIEGVTEVAKKYYDWSGGKAFFGRDAVANYMLIGAKQLGVEIFKVKNGTGAFQVERETMKKLWDNYYIPSIYGCFGSYGKFRSDDTKVGDLLAFVGSSSSAGYFPKEVFVNEDESYPIDALVLQAPVFEGGEPCAVQQGAGMAVIQSTGEQEYAAVQFMKWFTQEERNTSFSILSGYLPVKKAALSREKLEEALANTTEPIEGSMQEALKVAADTCTEKTLYTNKAFQGGTSARKVLESAMTDKISSDVALIEEQMEQGISREEAAKGFDTEENFDNWMQDLKEKLDETQKE